MASVSKPSVKRHAAGHAYLCTILGMGCVQSLRGEMLRGIVCSSSQGLVMGCQQAGVVVPQGVLLRQVVMLLVNA